MTDHYSKLRNIDKRIAGLEQAEKEAQAAVTARFQVKRNTLAFERGKALMEINAIGSEHEEELEIAGPAIISEKPPGVVIEAIPTSSKVSS